MPTEAERQQALLQAVLSAAAPVPAVAALWRAPRAGAHRGLQVYQAHAGASAERALAAAFPTVAALIGAESMAALARVYWHAQPPGRGDLGELGEGLPAFIADSPSLADDAYLPDVATLDWQVHRAGRAADAPEGVPGLQRLGDTDPAALRLRLAPGTALLRSRWPVGAMWHAHQATDEEGRATEFAQVRAALAAGHGENVLVWREGWRVQVAALAPVEAAFTEGLLAGQVLSQALDAAPELDFAGWLGEALQRGRLSAVEVDGTEEEST